MCGGIDLRWRSDGPVAMRLNHGTACSGAAARRCQGPSTATNLLARSTGGTPPNCRAAGSLLRFGRPFCSQIHRRSPTRIGDPPQAGRLRRDPGAAAVASPRNLGCLLNIRRQHCRAAAALVEKVPPTSPKWAGHDMTGESRSIGAPGKGGYVLGKKCPWKYCPKPHSGAPPRSGGRARKNPYIPEAVFMGSGRVSLFTRAPGMRLTAKQRPCKGRPATAFRANWPGHGLCADPILRPRFGLGPARAASRVCAASRRSGRAAKRNSRNWAAKRGRAIQGTTPSPISIFYLENSTSRTLNRRGGWPSALGETAYRRGRRAPAAILDIGAPANAKIVTKANSCVGQEEIGPST